MELRDYIRVLRAHWVGALVLILCGVVAAGIYTVTQPKVYAANANGFVTTGGAADPALASVTDSLAKSRAASYVNIATSRAVAQIVVDDLGLRETPSSLINKIQVDQPIDTVLIKITAESSSPVKAQQLADAWVRALATRVDEVENPSGSDNPGIIGVEPIEEAALPSAAVSPRPELNLVLGLIAGLLLGVAYAVIRSRLDRRLRDAAVVESRFAVPIIGRIPVAKGTDQTRASLTLARAEEREHWGASEAFRKLRTNLAYMNVDEPPRVIVVTSPRPGDGKSTTASNLATAIGLSGQDVVLVDGDLRRPTVVDSLGLIEGAGLTDVLIGSAELDDVLQKHPNVPSLTVLGAGSVPPNPSELLASQAMRALLQNLRDRGIVVIDAPPLLPVTDAAVLTRNSDGAIVVISYGATLDTELGEALNNLRSVKGTILGVVFNRVPRKDSTYGAYYGDYYTTKPSASKGAGTDATEGKTSRMSLRKG